MTTKVRRADGGRIDKALLCRPCFGGPDLFVGTNAAPVFMCAVADSPGSQ